jgi:hypothetical protein
VHLLFELQQFRVHSGFVHPILELLVRHVVHLEGDGILVSAVRVLGRFDIFEVGPDR